MNKEPILVIDTENYIVPINEPYIDLDCDKAYELYYDKELDEEPICEWCEECFYQDIDYLTEEAEKRNKSGYWILTGSAGLWNGSHTYEPHMLTIDEFIDRLINSDIDNFELELYEDGVIVGKGYHHDGINYYELLPLSNIDNEEIIDLIIGEDFLGKKRKELNEISKEYFNKNLDELTKDELTELIYKNRDFDTKRIRFFD